MKKAIAFFKGVKEFRLSFTTHYDDLNLLKIYDHGRNFAHKITFHNFENK